MAAALLQARGPLQQAIGIITKHVGDQRPPQRERAGLIEDHLIQGCCGFDHISTPKQPTASRCQTGGHSDHGGSCQAQRTGACHHKHRNRELER